MGLIYDVFDRFSIISILIGLVLGIYLAIHHNESNLWISSIPFILIFSILMTIFPIGQLYRINLKMVRLFQSMLLLKHSY